MAQSPAERLQALYRLADAPLRIEDPGRARPELSCEVAWLRAARADGLLSERRLSLAAFLGDQAAGQVVAPAEVVSPSWARSWSAARRLLAFGDLERPARVALSCQLALRAVSAAGPHERACRAHLRAALAWVEDPTPEHESDAELTARLIAAILEELDEIVRTSPHWCPQDIARYRSEQATRKPSAPPQDETEAIMAWGTKVLDRNCDLAEEKLRIEPLLRAVRTVWASWAPEAAKSAQVVAELEEAAEDLEAPSSRLAEELADRLLSPGWPLGRL